jgi:ligand-binding sensor domain-containing protein
MRKQMLSILLMAVCYLLLLLNTGCNENSSSNNVITPEFLAAPNGETVTAIAIDNNDVWAGTYNGLFRLNMNTGERTCLNAFENTIPENWIFSVAVENGGVVWVDVYHSMYSYCLMRYDGKKWDQYCPILSPDIVDTLHFQKIVIDQQNNKWVFGNGLARLDASFTWKLFDSNDSILFRTGFIRSCACDKDGNLFLGNDHGIVKFNGSSWQLFEENSSAETPSIIHIAIDRENTLWTISRIYGGREINFLQYLDGNKLMRMKPNVPDYTIATCMIADNDNGIWIGTENMGLLRCKDSLMLVYKPETEYRFTINAIAMGKNGDVWLGTDGYGLIRFDGANWNVYDLYQ